MQITVDCGQHQAYKYGAFREAFLHVERYFGYCRCPDDASLGREVLQLWLRMGAVNGDANRSQLHAKSGLSIRHFPRSFYTYM
jgi:hypothetical protein